MIPASFPKFLKVGVPALQVSKKIKLDTWWETNGSHSTVLGTAVFRSFQFCFGIRLKSFCTEHLEQSSVVAFYILAKENEWFEWR